MTEPILTREEVEALAHRICMTYVHSDYVDMRRYTFGILTLEQLAAAIEAAVLEKVCGEPVAYASEEGLRMLSSREEVCVWSPDSPLRRQRDIPIFTLTRSKP